MTCISTMFKKQQGNTLFLRISIDATERFFHTSLPILRILERKYSFFLRILDILDIFYQKMPHVQQNINILLFALQNHQGITL